MPPPFLMWHIRHIKTTSPTSKLFSMLSTWGFLLWKKTKVSMIISQECLLLPSKRRAMPAFFSCDYPIKTFFPSKAKPYFRICSVGIPAATSADSYCFSSICKCAAVTVSCRVFSVSGSCTLNSKI